MPPAQSQPESPLSKESEASLPSSSVLNAEGHLDKLRKLFNKNDNDPLKVVGIGAGAWGTVFLAMIQETYGHLHDKIDVRIWRRGGKALDKDQAQKLFSLINSREDILRRLLRNCAYLKYVEGRIGDRVLYADEILRDGFCLNLPNTPVCPLQVSTDLQEVVWDADILINSLPSTETKSVFEKIGLFWKERRKPLPVIVSLSKGVDAVLEPEPHIITPTLMIRNATGVELEKLLYLGGPNIAEEIFNKEYANARICGSAKWRKALADFFRQPHFLVWDNPDLVTHEVMGGLKNVYAIGAGMVSALTQESATSKAVYFSHCIAEMIFITHLISECPENLAGPLMADTYITLLKGRNSWYGSQLASGKLTLEMGDNFQGRGTIQGISAVDAFFTVLSKTNILVNHPVTNEPIQPLMLCPILRTLHSILHTRDLEPKNILETLQDENACDPGQLLTINSISKSSLSHLIERHSSFKGPK